MDIRTRIIAAELAAQGLSICAIARQVPNFFNIQPYSTSSDAVPPTLCANSHVTAPVT